MVRMLGLWVALLAVGALLGAGVRADEVREGPVVVRPRDGGIGERVGDVAFVDVNGEPGKLSDYSKSKAVVLCMTSASCPVARKYGPTIVELQKRYAAAGVTFVAVNASPADSNEKIAGAAAEFARQGYTGRYVADGDSSVARALGA